MKLNQLYMVGKKFRTPGILLFLLLGIKILVSGQLNYIRTFNVTAPEQNANTLTSKWVSDVNVATQYFDGLGRSVQTVIKQGSFETSNGVFGDVVSPIVYDAFGREEFKHLPYVSSGNTGLYRNDPLTEQQSFMSAQYGAQGETFFYSKTNFETSPLNRPEKAMPPGNSWVGSNRGVGVKYWINTVIDDVKIWNVTDVVNGFGTYTVNGVYPAGELYKNVTVDEHGKQVIEFKDKEGKLILKKVQIGAVAGTEDDGTGRGYDGWLCTYYVYDGLDNLRCVVQPEAVQKMSSPIANWDVSNYQNEQCFRYEYNSRQRMIMKKVPGAGEVWMVYDGRDRLVMVQDAAMRNLPTQKWMITKYDALNRPIETGLWNNDGTSFTNHLLNAYNNNTSYPSTATGYELLSITHYDDYAALPAGLSAYQTSWNSYFAATDNSNWPYPQMPEQSVATKGMVTWTQVKVLGTTNQFINTVSYFDIKGRVIQVQSTNITGGTDISSTQYSWAGQVLVNVQKQQKGGTVNPQDHIVITKMTYDDLGRVLTVKKTINSTVNGVSISKPEQQIAQQEYDRLGQLKKTTLGANNLETLDYEYNIRGWMLGINRDYARDANSTNYFGFDLGYDKANNSLIGGQPYNNPQYNGNIEGMVWKSKGDGEKRKYDFYYDAANRLLKGDFSQYTGGSFNQNAGINYNMKMGDGADPFSAYDANGNIKAMTQYGWKLGGNPLTPIDILRYTYNTSSNRLKSVTDFANDPLTKLGDFKTNSSHPQAAAKTTLNASSTQPQFDAITDYNYDVNGNLSLDNNKDISSITYNHLNLPSQITVTGKGIISYTYDAAGNKLKKEVAETGQPVKITQYVGGVVYENDVLQFMGQEEGRIRFKAASGPVSASFEYDYMLKDHLGNVRMLLTEEQQSSIYPAATLETALLGVEDDFYLIDPSKIVLKSEANGIPDYPNNNVIQNNNTACTGTLCTTTTSDKLYKLNGNTNKTGLGITLKVMAGDEINIFGKSYYTQANPGGGGTNPNGMVLEILTGFLGGPSGGAASGAHGGITAGQLNNLSATTGGIHDLINLQNFNQPTAPTTAMAFINYLFFDEQFNYVSGGFSQVNSPNQLKDHYMELQNKVAQKNGYVYIYCSNESAINVFFDNLQIVHSRGAILEESHYYPFGLTMNGISSNALVFGKPENKEKTFQNQRFDDELGLNWVQFKWRNHDPQIGRFVEIDPLSEKYVYNSTYAFSENKVVAHVELEGLESAWAEGNVERDLRDVSSGKISTAQLEERLAARAGASKIGSTVIAVGASIAAAIVVPGFAAVGSAAILSYMSGAPVTPTSAMAGTVVSEMSSIASASDDAINTVSLATKARVFEAGGEIGMMDGAATLAVDVKTGFFNVKVTAGTEAGIITGEVNISKGVIGFTNLEITNAAGGLGAIEKQGSIGFATFSALQKELTALSQAGGYSKGYLEFSRLRPIGSKLPNSETRTISLFGGQ